MSFLEWLGRVVMLVLAGMITLSIISALAAISSTTVPQQLGLEKAQAPAPPAPEPIAPSEQTEARPEPAMGENVVAETAQSVASPVQPEAASVARWLEAITYALLALAGLAVLGCVLLWRLLHQQRRIADALSAGPPPSFAPPTAALRGG